MSCSYGPRSAAQSSELQLTVRGEFHMEDPYQISLQDSTLSIVNASLSGLAGLTPCQGLELQLGRSDLAILHRYYIRTSLTFGIPSMRSLYRDDASHLAKLVSPMSVIEIVSPPGETLISWTRIHS